MGIGNWGKWRETRETRETGGRKAEDGMVRIPCLLLVRVYAAPAKVGPELLVVPLGHLCQALGREVGKQVAVLLHFGSKRPEVPLRRGQSRVKVCLRGYQVASQPARVPPAGEWQGNGRRMSGELRAREARHEDVFEGAPRGCRPPSSLRTPI